MSFSVFKTFIWGCTIFTIISMLGCGHNTVVYSDGIGLETTANPETFTFGLNFRYGKILTACVKEKTELDLKSGFKQNSSMNPGENINPSILTAMDAELHLKTGDQVTGYTVELEKVRQVK